jgi:hypothetical protein
MGVGAALMREKPLESLPEVFVSNAKLTDAVGRELKAGRLRKLASRLYTRNLRESPESLVRRNLWQLVAAYFPGALIADRSSLDVGPAKDGSVFIIAKKNR